MVDQGINTLEQYDLEIKGVRKGRGNLIVNCKEGEFVLKEYNGSESRASLQKMLTDRIRACTGVLAQEIVPNKAGDLYTKDADDKKYMLQTYMEGRECDIKENRECTRTIITMARMHRGMILEQSPELQGVASYSLQDEFAKRNNELRRIRRYLKEKKQKSEFERFVYKHFNYFFEEALSAEEGWKQYATYAKPSENSLTFCHGDFQHHNVWMNYKEIMILQFEKFLTDLPCRDLYQFLRKYMEKNHWDNALGKELLQVYENERPLPFAERISMVYRFSYPEKFWKIMNYYFNSKKSFLPEKNMEKLVKVLEQERDKAIFVERTLRGLL